MPGNSLKEAEAIEKHKTTLTSHVPEEEPDKIERF
jgi:hypothetical protein